MNKMAPPAAINLFQLTYTSRCVPTSKLQLPVQHWWPTFGSKHRKQSSDLLSLNHANKFIDVSSYVIFFLSL
jgi:hypothetical protein